jgi:L-aminopeptidase/D-esterase-like protein
VGQEITEQKAYASRIGPHADNDVGSIIVVLATNAPLLPHQLKRIARRASMGIARTGGTASNSSGEIFIAFSTANSGAGAPNGVPSLKMIPNERITPFFQAAAEATEEAIVNALVAAETMTGRDGHEAIALPHDRLVALLAKYNRRAAH